jgi:RHS repeat-associated protein
MGNFFLLLLFLLQLSSTAFCTIKNEDILAATEGEPLARISDHVNALTGDFTLFEEDYVIPGVEPIPLRRIYVSGNGKGHNGGWEFLPHLKLDFPRISCRDTATRRAHVYEPSGARLTYKLQGKEIRQCGKYALDFEKHGIGITNTAQGTISGRTNLKNSKLERTSATTMHLTCADGTQRFYTHMYEKVYDNLYLVDTEILPNQNRILYTYDDEQRIKFIKTTNPSITKTYAWAKFTYFGKSEKNHDFNIETSDGKTLEYRFEKHKVFGKKCFYLTSVKTPTHPEAHVEYTEKQDYCGPLLHKHILPEGHQLMATYYEPGKNDVEGTRVRVHDDKDPRCARVKALYAPVGTDQQMLMTYRFFYHISCEKGLSYNNYTEKGITEIHDSQGCKTVIRFNPKTFLPIVIETYNEKNQIHHTLDMEWEGYGELKRKTLRTGTGEEIWARELAYDSRGNVVAETFSGNLEGKGTRSSTVKRMHYNKDNLVERVEEENGTVTSFTYLPGTPLATAKYRGDKTRILQREFIEYDNDNQIARTISDDGISWDKDNLSDVTERTIKLITRVQEGPAIGLPGCIEERYLQSGTAQEKLLRKTVFFYRADLKVERRDVYDATGTLRYSLHTKYDEKGRLCEESDPEGKVTKIKYDQFGNQIQVDDSSGRLTRTTQYDASNRPIKSTESTFDGISHTTQHSYTPKHFKVFTQDPFGNATNFHPDVFGNIAQTDLPQVENWRPVSKSTFDSDFREISTTDPRGDITLRRYTSYGKPSLITYADGTEEQFLYNEDGTLREKTDIFGVKTEHEYDALGREISRTKRENNRALLVETWTYSGLRLTSYTNPQGFTTTYGYDGAGRKNSEQDDLQTTEFYYDPLGRVSFTRVTDKQFTQFHFKMFDLLDRCIEERFEDDSGTVFSKTNFKYDRAGNKSEIIRTVGSQETHEMFIYDGFNRLITHLDAEGHKTTISYNENHRNSLGQRVLEKTHIDPKGVRTIEIHDALGRTVSIEKKNPFDETLTLDKLHYDIGGSLCRQESVVIANHEYKNTVTTLWEYGCMGKLKTLTEAAGTPEQKVTHYSYNKTGLLDETIKPDGVILRRTYNSLGQEDSLISSDNTISYRYGYTKLGQIAGIENTLTRKRTTRDYTRKGQLLIDTFETGRQIVNSYDGLGRRYECQLPDESTISYTYDAYYLREVARITRKGAILYTHQFTHYDASGNLLEQKLINNLGTITHQLDSLERITELATPFGSQECTSFDALSNLTQTRFNFPFHQENRTYIYNELSQLTAENNHVFSYDSRHNRLSHNNQPYTVNAISALVTAPNATFTYDSNGNPIRKSTPAGDTIYTYDALDRLTAIVTPTERYTYAYDGFHRRVSSTKHLLTNNSWVLDEEHIFLYDDLNEIGATDSAHHITQLRVLGLTSNAEIGAAIALELYGDTYLPLHDVSGNVIALYSLSGVLLESYTYTAYGQETIFDSTHKPLSSSRHSNPWRFCSKRTDDTHLVYFGRRFYDPSLGRWLSPDPKGLTPATSTYAFVNNRPLTLLDLYGLEAGSPGGGGAVSRFFDTSLEWMGRGIEVLGASIRYTFQHLVPVPAVRGFGIQLGDGIAHLAGGKHTAEKEYHSHIDVVGTRKPSKNHSIILVNGIMTANDESEACANYLSKSMGGIQVVRVYGATHGFAMDMIECIAECLGIMTNTDRMLKLSIQQQIRAMGGTEGEGTVHLIAHSQGGFIARNATYDLSSAERRMVDVTTFGSACAFAPNGLKAVHHFISSRDFAFFLDVPGYVTQGSNGRVTILKSRHRGLIDHSIMGDTYKAGLEKKGKDIQYEIEKSL